MRKLAREAVICVLLVPAVLTLGLIVSGQGLFEGRVPVALGLVYGPFIGLGLWILYRLVRFAIKG
jgi:hypothetical protein